MNKEIDEKAQDMREKVKNGAEKGVKMASESGKDWLNYINQHPVQSIAFGAVIALAIRGLIKN